MLTRVLETIKENSMLKAGDNVICAVSGGADSMALLCALYEIKDELGIKVYAAHLNHSIRGDEAEGDYLFVKNFCQERGIELFYRKVDIPYLAIKMHKSEEEAGREERYRLFYESAEKLGGAKIATGHHKNDRAETVLFNLFRGSGARGMRGIPYKRDNIIRPLLDISRRDTEKFLEQRGILWREDATNKECIYSRNRIRLVILKEIEKLFPDAVEKIVSAAEAVRLDDEYLTHLARESGAFDPGVIDKEKFISLHPSLQGRIIIDALKYWGVSDINAEKMRAVSECVLGATGKRRDLGDGVRIENSYGKIKKVSPDIFKKSEEYIFPVCESLEI
ncbi:MAG: tRNA lysidine(34) synthetase TilS [Clostridia bacterium]|nr:tRNA lysidine(34) synthetase TilS [Clostridia bacterium]